MRNLTRRLFLLGSAALLLPAVAVAQDADNSPLIIREDIPGVDPRYASYATQGPYVFSASPTTVKGRGFDYMVFFPRNHKSPRLIVFSHGAVAEPLAYRDLLWHWASHGFVVVAPLHRDSIIENGPSLRKTSVDSVSDWAISALLEDPVAWQERAEACVSVLDDLRLIKEAVGQEINVERPIIVGHGYGAYVAQMLLGASVKDGESKRRTFADPRFFAGIMMSPQGPGVMGLDESSWANISAPSLYLLAENEIDFTGQPYQEKAKSYRLAKPGYKHVGLLKNGSANTFSGQGARSNATEKKLFEVLKAISTAFLLAYGDYEKQAFQDMTTDFFERMSLGAIDEGRR
ncbi:alpha/beta hydrolase family protein [Mesorhizobium sp. SP-1A]|uniref:alpha/beta hydrolase family protein n=1 Tax=Mesorhizobium sp. SP-1A TaxID=3077840 RepID=UPI0028F6DACB|nr:alpha/beta fold hydrolase [Mesorhizobium sp. SP-1A]